MLQRNNGGYVAYLEYFSSLFESWKWDDAPPAEDIYREFQLRFPEYSTLFSDAVPVLKELRRRGFRLGIITNGPSVQQNRKLDVSGVRPYMDIAVVSGDEQVHKPDPEIFRPHGGPAGDSLLLLCICGGPSGQRCPGLPFCRDEAGLYQSLLHTGASAGSAGNPYPYRAAKYAARSIGIAGMTKSQPDRLY